MINWRATLKAEWPVLLLLLADLGITAWAWPRLPAQVPIHWGVNGQPDNFAPAWVAGLLLPAAIWLLYLYLLTTGGTGRMRHYPPMMQRLYRGLVMLVVIVAHAASLLAATSAPH